MSTLPLNYNAQPAQMQGDCDKIFWYGDSVKRLTTKVFPVKLVCTLVPILSTNIFIKAANK